MPTRLFSLNREVNALNKMHFDRLPGKVFTFTAIDCSSGERAKKCMAAIKRDCPAPETLQLKKDAQVILLKNIAIDKGLCNGSRGVVLEMVHLSMLTVEDMKGQGFEAVRGLARSHLHKNAYVPLVYFANNEVPTCTHL